MTTELSPSLISDAPAASEVATPRLRAHVGAAGASQRAIGFEVMRLIASMEIVWFHVQAPGARIAYGGLPALMALSVLLSVGSPERSVSASTVVRKRWQRLMVPWLFWSVVYAVARLASAFGSHRHVDFDWTMVLTGTWSHLWYLPYAFVVTTVIALGVARGWFATMEGRASLFLWPAVIALSIVGFESIFAHVRGRAPIAQWVFVAPAVFMGLAGGLILTRRHASHVATALLILLATVAGCGVAAKLGFSWMGLPLICGATLLALAMLFQSAAPPAIQSLSGLSFGVYLIHPLCAGLLERTLPWSNRSEFAVLVCLLSLASAAILRRGGLGRFL